VNWVTSRGAGRTLGASVYTRTRLSLPLSLSLSLSLSELGHLNAHYRLKAWCLLIHTEASLYLSELGHLNAHRFTEPTWT